MLTDKKSVVLIIISLFVGGIVFWGSFGIEKFWRGNAYGRGSVGFLTVFVPLITYRIVRLWHEKILPPQKNRIQYSIGIGILGPLLFLWLYSIVTIDIPVAQQIQFHGLSDYLTFFLTGLIIGPLSILTYTGMLGAFIINIVLSIILGMRLSKAPRSTQKKPGLQI